MKKVLCLLLLVATFAGSVSFADFDNNLFKPPQNLTNGGSGTVTGMIFSSNAWTSVWIDYNIGYVASSPTTILTESGTISLLYDGTNGWRVLNGDAQFDVSGVAFTVNSSTGQVSYSMASSNAGTPSSFKLNWRLRNAF